MKPNFKPIGLYAAVASALLSPEYLSGRRTFKPKPSKQCPVCQAIHQHNNRFCSVVCCAQFEGDE